MKNYKYLFFLLLISLFSEKLVAQEVMVQINLPPTGHFTVDDLYHSLILTNLSQETYVVTIHGTVDIGGTNERIFDGVSSPVELLPGVTPISPANVDDVEIIHADADYEDALLQTGSLPAGLYIICVEVINEQNGDRLTIDCIEHEVMHQSMPQLILPDDGALVFEEYPIFTWIPPMPPSPNQMLHYQVKMVEVYDGQVPYEAMESNPAWYLEEDQRESSFIYPMDGNSFEPMKTYAWQVQVFEENGLPVGENDGKSEIFTFTFQSLGEPDISIISPVVQCEGYISENAYLRNEMLDVVWEYNGNFTQFQIVLSGNPCGKHPGPTPTPVPGPKPSPSPTPTPQPSPTPVPTPTPTDTVKPGDPPPPPPDPGGGIVAEDPEEETDTTTTQPPIPSETEPEDWGDEEEGIAPLPPGWRWTPGGPEWTGELPPEPPELPPGWKWTAGRPAWVGEGDPPNQEVIGVSEAVEPLPISIGSNEPSTDYLSMDISEYVSPGQAFIYQVYGVLETPDGELEGYLSEQQCMRYMQPNESGDMPEKEDCGKQGCTLAYSWIRKTPITIIKPISSYPAGDGLKEMIPGSCISFNVLATDVDLLKQVCQGKEDCLERTEAVKRIGPIEHDINYNWTFKGEDAGGIIKKCNNTIFYQTPKKFKKGESKKATIECHLANIGGKAQDEPIEGKIEITTSYIDSCKCINAEVTITQPVLKNYDDDFEEKECKICKPADPVWEKEKEISGELKIQKEICPNAMVMLDAAYSDLDKLKIKCDAGKKCGEDEKSLPLNDPLDYTWNDAGAGGYFPLGNSGPCVVYVAPDEEKSITFNVNIKDSGTQFNDPKKDETKNSEVKKLLDLKEISVGGSAKYKNVTTGHVYKFKPVWEPKSSKIKKIIWELDLGGKNGKIKKVLCDPDGLSQDEATLKFTTKKDEKDLEFSWKKRSHTHGIKTLKCEIFGDAVTCGDCCICSDDEWEKSDFMKKDDLKWNQFNLYFDKVKNKDNGKVESLANIGQHDKWGETTILHGRTCDNWFMHWSSSTYGTCVYDHQNSDPKVLYKKNPSWRGLYEPEKEQITLSNKSTLKSKRAQWQGRIWVRSSNMKWIDTRKFSQKAFDLKGHNLCNKVYVHELGHFMSMTRNWRSGVGWNRSYGSRSTTDTRKESIPIESSNHITTTVTKTGNYSNRMADGLDCIQKYNVTIQIYEGYGNQRRIKKTISLKEAWLKKFVSIKWEGSQNNRVGTLKGPTFEFITSKGIWKSSGLVLRIYDRANDPDEDYVPNLVEDQMGLNWNSSRTHKNHARGSYTTSNGTRQLPDQEFYADQYAFDRWNLIEPGYPKQDWANPGAQTTPPYK